MTEHPTGSSRLDLAGGGGRLKDTLLIGALVVIIVAALAMAIAYVCGDDDQERKTPGAIMFKCLDCDAEFEYDHAKQPKGTPDTKPMKRMGPARCQSCNKLSRALQMTRCPECKQHYLSASARYQHEKDTLERQGKDASALGQCPPTVCPYCRTDLHTWYRQYDARRRGR